MKKIVTLIVTILIMSSIAALGGSEYAYGEAADQNITVKDFIQELVAGIDLEIQDSFTEPYLMAAANAGLLDKTDFKNDFEQYITRTDAAVLINRADEYLHGDTVDADLLKLVSEKRISDIKEIAKDKREDVAKCIAKGIIQGYTNGYYIKNRSFRGSEYLTEKKAKAYIKLITKNTKRAKLSPDGLLIRTTKLPSNAKDYEYILACYPNKFYERQFEFMVTPNWKTKRDPQYYGYPVEMRDSLFRNWYTSWPFSEEMDKYLYDWQVMVEKYLQYIFNVDYRTVDDEWIEGLASLYTHNNIDRIEHIKTYYIGAMKENKVVIESSIIAVEPSILYEDRGYCMRAYVRYRITAKNINVDQYKLLYANYPTLDNLKGGEWREGIFDIRFGTSDGCNGDGSNFTIDDSTFFVDAFNVPVK